MKDIGETHEDEALLDATVAAVQSAGSHLMERFSADAPRFRNLAEIVAAIHANDEASLALLREPLMAARPGSQWAEEEDEGGELPPGEWWITDPVEGNINHIHGLADWGVTATLLRENVPVLTAIHLPLSSDTYTAVRGGGAWLDGVRLHPSKKAELNAALVGTGQAKPGEGGDTFRRIRPVGHSHAESGPRPARLGAGDFATHSYRGRTHGRVLAIQPGPLRADGGSAAGRGGRRDDLGHPWPALEPCERRFPGRRARPAFRRRRRPVHDSLIPRRSTSYETICRHRGQQWNGIGACPLSPCSLRFSSNADGLKNIRAPII